MLGTPAIRNLIRENKIAQMYSSIQTSAGDGMITLDQTLKNLVSRGTISREVARPYAKQPETFL
jgi:twitching motility protein PilT